MRLKNFEIREPQILRDARIGWEEAGLVGIIGFCLGFLYRQLAHLPAWIDIIVIAGAIVPITVIIVVIAYSHVKLEQMRQYEQKLQEMIDQLEALQRINDHRSDSSPS
ncbi:MAG TPA: hypothetical protein VH593_07695 [Ktedonobacteraceae bacterium]|jgi:uncharacterized membrane protein (DUF106 family)